MKKKLPTASILYADYRRERSIFRVADLYGVCGETIRQRLMHGGYAIPRTDKWSEEEIALLRQWYEQHEVVRGFELNRLASQLGRLKSNVCRKARILGLTQQGRRKTWTRKVRLPKFATKAELYAHIGSCTKERFARGEHPKGFLGKKHSAAASQAISAAHIALWQAMPEEKLAARNMKSARTRAKTMAAGAFANERKGCTWKAGWREIGRHKKYFRSRWEANYARYLQFLMERGQIRDWEYEAETFWFEGVRRGTCSYLPDFKIRETDGSVSYHEVKGWMDARSKTKLRRMADYYPDVKLELVGAKQYEEIARKLGRMIPGWERDRS